MKKILMGLALIVFLGSVMYVTYGVSKKNQMAAVYSSRSTYGYGYGSPKLTNTTTGSPVTTVSGKLDMTKKCPCTGGYTYNALHADYVAQSDVIKRNEKFIKDRPNLSATDKAEANRIIKEATEALAEIVGPMNDALKQYSDCVKKPENKALYKAPPNPGMCYRATLPVPDSE